MNQIKQVLLMHNQKVSNRQIAKTLGLSKDTVNSYVRQAEADSLGLNQLIDLEDTVLEYRLKKGNPAYTDPRFEELKELLPYYESELQRRHVTMHLLWQEYISEHPGGYSQTQFRFHCNQHMQAQKTTRAKTVLTDMYRGGEQLFLDYAGDTLSYIDMETGEEVRTQTFVAVLPATDYAYVLCVPSQRTEDFVYACIKCFHAIGGVPRILVPDNLKAAVVKTDRYEPSVNEVMNDMANHYHCVVMPARPVHPKDKSNVEAMVKLIYRRVYAALRNRKFYSINELNAAVQECVRQMNQTRMQNYGYSREERFLAIDKPNLMPLPETDFEIKYRASLKVQENNFVYLSRDKHSYSVPYRHIGSQADVIYTRSIVKIYIKGELVATHARSHVVGGYTYEEEHLATHARVYRNRCPEYYINCGKSKLEILGRLIGALFESSTAPAETLYRSCDGLLSLQKNTDPAIFIKACETALAHGRHTYGFVKQMCESKCTGLDSNEVQSPKTHGNIRGAEFFK